MEPTGSLAALFSAGDLPLWRLLHTTILLLGLQFTWAVELAYGTPYLLALGLDKSLTSLVWLAGPLSGLIVQPIIGTLSDNHRSRHGKRRPFIVGGAVCMILRNLGTPNSPLNGPGVPGKPSEKGSSVSIWLAVFGFYLLDFSINIVQSASRALIVDVIPLSQQQTANACASIMIALGNIVGYTFGLLDLSSLLKVHSQSEQMKLLCMIATIVFSTCVAWTVYMTSEKPTNTSIISVENKPWYQAFVNIVKTTSLIPKFVLRICYIQFFSWIGWFPLLFYSTTYVATYVSKSHRPFDGPEGDRATRIGSRAFLCFSMVSFFFSVLLPIMASRKVLSLRDLWCISLVAFAIISWLTLFVSSSFEAQMLVACFGFCWSITTWVPMALIGEYVNENEISDKESDYESGDERGKGEPSHENVHNSTNYSTPLARSPVPYTNHDELFIESDDNVPLREDLSSSSRTVLTTREGESLQQPAKKEAQMQLSAGSILGMHNCFIVMPQLLVSLLSSAIFSFTDEDAPVQAGDRNDSIGWLFRIGGVSALISFVLCRRLSA